MVTHFHWKNRLQIFRRVLTDDDDTTIYQNIMNDSLCVYTYVYIPAIWSEFLRMLSSETVPSMASSNCLVRDLKAAKAEDVMQE